MEWIGIAVMIAAAGWAIRCAVLHLPIFPWQK